jgi:hypothetical protein
MRSNERTQGFHYDTLGPDFHGVAEYKLYTIGSAPRRAAAPAFIRPILKCGRLLLSTRAQPARIAYTSLDVPADVRA